MRKVVKLIMLTLLIFMKTYSSNYENRAPYIKHVHEIAAIFAKEMKDKYDLNYIGGGGSMPYDVQRISAIFSIIKKPTLDEAREYEVRAIERLLELINNHEGIRPYLAEYPFDSKRVDISISFDDKHNQHYTDGTVTFVFIAKNHIFFDRVEKVIKTRGPFYDSEGRIKEPINEKYETTAFVTVLKEPYEESLAKVQNLETSLIEQNFGKKSQGRKFKQQDFLKNIVNEIVKGHLF